jgi:RNA polymerase sigma-70 factor (ECF subfamily)
LRQNPPDDPTKTLPPKTDWVSLWRGTLAGDRRSTNEFVRLIEPGVHRLFLSLARNSDIARELTQEFFLRLFENDKRRLSLFDPSRSVPLPKYLGVVARHQFFSWRRRKGTGMDDESVRLEDVAAVLGTDPTVVQELAVRELYEAVDRLEGPERLAVLYRLDGLRDREIAEVMGLAVGTVATLLRRARLRLRDDLDGGWYHMARGDE